MLHLTCAVSCVQCLSFIIICLVVYFIVVMPMNALMNKFFVSPVPPDSLQAHTHSPLKCLRWHTLLVLMTQLRSVIHPRLHASKMRDAIACLVICCQHMRRDWSISGRRLLSRRSYVSDWALGSALQPKAPKVKCPHCLEEIAKGATRCKWCTSEVDEENVLPAPNMGKEVPAKPVSKKDEVTPPQMTCGGTQY